MAVGTESQNDAVQHAVALPQQGANDLLLVVHRHRVRVLGQPLLVDSVHLTLRDGNLAGKVLLDRLQVGILVRGDHAPLVRQQDVPLVPPGIDARLLERRGETLEEGGQRSPAQCDGERVAGAERVAARLHDGIAQRGTHGRFGRGHEHLGLVAGHGAWMIGGGASRTVEGWSEGGAGRWFGIMVLWHHEVVVGVVAPPRRCVISLQTTW
mmetsp:Transcript_54642/g.116090  ORF Transcript_54642/g.116090 Transcript_54642/m.116090 type:complete len:210 (-) Transcript_54642:11-640(-)